MHVIHMRTYFTHPIVLPYALYCVVIVLGEPLGEPLLPVCRYPLTIKEALSDCLVSALLLKWLTLVLSLGNKPLEL
jgi:hypothetical protein